MPSIATLLHDAKQQLNAAALASHIEPDDVDISLTAECLLAHCLGKSRSYLFAFSEVVPSTQQQESFANGLHKAIKGKPLAYITGIKEFWSLEFQVNEHTLIPRPDSETLIDALLSYYCADTADKKLSFIDLGTGSGALAIALKSEQTHWQAFAADYSLVAAQVAQQNSQQLGHCVHFLQGDWLTAIAANSLDIVISNPPYIDEADEHLAALKYEPISALVADDNGYSDLQKIIQQSLRCLKAGGTIWLEHGYDQAETVREYLRTAGFVDVCSYKDLSGIERISFGKLANKNNEAAI